MSSNCPHSSWEHDKKKIIIIKKNVKRTLEKQKNSSLVGGERGSVVPPSALFGAFHFGCADRRGVLRVRFRFGRRARGGKGDPIDNGGRDRRVRDEDFPHGGESSIWRK